MDKKRIHTLDALRGIASLAVCWFHLTNENAAFLPDGWLKSSGKFGWLGVEMFFVISGFIIPFSMWRAGYGVSDAPRFVLKRVIRLDPPYLVAIVCAIGLAYMSAMNPDFRGNPPSYSAAQILLHLGYLNSFFGYGWVIPVFWTLAIEFQFYLLMAVVFPLLMSQGEVVKMATVAAFGAGAFLLPGDRFIFRWLFLFLLGIVVAQYKAALINRRVLIAIFPLLIAGAWFTLGWLVALVGAATALAILSVRIQSRVLFFLGSISYSLYLAHFPIGGRVVNFGVRFADTLPLQLIVLAGALAASIGVAYLLHRFVERPAQEWSSRIKYRRHVDDQINFEQKPIGVSLMK